MHIRICFHGCWCINICAFCKTSKRYRSSCLKSISNGITHFVLSFPCLPYSSFKNRWQIKWATTKKEHLIICLPILFFLFCYFKYYVLLLCVDENIYMHFMNWICFSIKVFFYTYLRFTRSHSEMGRLLFLLFQQPPAASQLLMRWFFN